MKMGCFLLNKYPTTPSLYFSSIPTSTKLTLADIMEDGDYKHIMEQMKKEKEEKEAEAKKRAKKIKEMEKGKEAKNMWGSELCWSPCSTPMATASPSSTPMATASPCSTPGPDKQKKTSSKTYEEKLGGLWIKKIFTKAKLTSWEVHWNSEIPPEAQGNLLPFFISTKYRPDIWLSFRYEGKLYQLLLIEVLSNEDIDLTVAECERSLIHQIRVFRNLDRTVTEVIGFVIPTSKVPCELLEVTIRWNESNLKFESSLTILSKDELIAEIVRVAKIQEGLIKKMAHNHQDTFFLPINTRIIFKSEEAIQLPSGQSIVVANGKYVYKYIIDPETERNFRQRLIQHFSKLDTINCLSLPKMLTEDDGEHSVGRFRGVFMKYDRIIYPLVREEAKQCIIDFLQQSAQALLELHGIGFSHLDVRVENIGFKYTDDEVKAVLIDLDSFLPISDAPTSISTESRMCRPPLGISTSDNSHLDWKQFGIMAAYVASSPLRVSHQDYHSDKYSFGEIENDPFISKLICEGTIMDA